MRKTLQGQHDHDHDHDKKSTRIRCDRSTRCPAAPTAGSTLTCSRACSSRFVARQPLAAAVPPVLPPSALAAAALVGAFVAAASGSAPPPTSPRPVTVEARGAACAVSSEGGPGRLDTSHMGRRRVSAVSRDHAGRTVFSVSCGLNVEVAAPGPSARRCLSLSPCPARATRRARSTPSRPASPAAAPRSRSRASV